MKQLIVSVIIATVLISGSMIEVKAQDASSILKKMDDVMYSPKDQTGTTTIVLINKAGKESIREANVIQKGNDKRIFRFTAPSSQAGISVLSLPDDVMYLYMPAFGKERRISSSVKSQNFAGTDFSYDDMESIPYSKKYTPNLIETKGDSYDLELRPISPKSPYSKLIVKIHKTDYYPLSIEYFDRGNTKIKEAIYQFEKIGNYWNAKEIAMTDLKKNHKTKMIMSDVKYDQGISDDEFTVRRLIQ
jgi:outer membrane lipoprotein-sorting protein